MVQGLGFRGRVSEPPKSVEHWPKTKEPRACTMGHLSARVVLDCYCQFFVDGGCDFKPK